ncbi:MAG: hypothetical protein JKY50_01365 [Oleispira sp.]|nr:hypothetical protein [Oleispira sp.]MBL4881611.1 hypothetical protein [Oleispira sp.]
MNRDEAITKFIKINFKLLTSDDLVKSILKTEIRKYFIFQLSKKFGQPKPAEICSALFKYQIRNGVSKSALETQIGSIPIYENLGRNKIEELELMLDSNFKSSLSIDELDRIDKVNSYDAIKLIEGESIKREMESSNKELVNKRDELNKEIGKKQDELLAFPSILDEREIEEPEYFPELEDTKSWWERFYLKGNPFPGNKDGLSKVDESLYEKIVVKTQPYQTFLKKIDSVTSIFDTAYMLVGDFGYGKTTLQDYLSYHLANKNILPIRITCLRAQPDCNGYYDSFILRLMKELSKEIGGRAVRMDGADEERVIELCQEVCKFKAGVVIFLDDYHKHRTEYQTVYDFLGTLQILKNELTRNDCNVSFIVSAIPLWQREASQHQQMSGFFDTNPIVMPPPTPEFIRDVFNQRISAYCYDLSPRKIDIEFIEKIFSKSESKGNYRDYLNRIIEELENNNMAIVSTPIEISEDNLSKIKALIENEAALWSPMKKLLKESRFKKYNSEQIAKCLELLVVTYTQDGVSERELIFTENKHYFLRLKETGLIVRRRDSSFSNDFSWSVSPSLEKCASKIKSDYGYILPDYLLKIYSHKKTFLVESKVSKSESAFLSKIKAFINDKKMFFTENQRKNLDKALVLYDRFDIDPSSKQKTDKAVDDMIEALTTLSFVLFDIDGTLEVFERNGIENITEKWKLHHIDNEIVDQFYYKLDYYNKARDSIQYSLTSRHAKDAFEFIADQIKSAVLDITSESVDRFGYINIQTQQNPNDVALYEMIRNDIFLAGKETKFRYVEQISDHTEGVIKNFLYTSCKLIFGDDKYFKHVNIQDGKSKYSYLGKNFSSIHNLYEGLSRAKLYDVFMYGSQVKKIIIDKLDLNWSESQWKYFFSSFIDSKNISSKNESECISYCKMCTEIIGSMNVFLSKIPSERCFLIIDDEKYGIEDVMFEIKFDGVVDDYIVDIDSSSLSVGGGNEVHVIDRVIYDRVKKIILSKLNDGYNIENLLDPSFIESHYCVKYYEFIISLAYMEKIEKTIIISSWMGSHILIRKKLSAVEMGLLKDKELVDIESHEFQVALSFPSEVRDKVLDITKELHLALGKDTFFYDDNYKSQLARPNLDKLLQKIYKENSKMIVVFICKEYDEKEWCGLEFRVVRELLMEKKNKRIMLVKMGEGEVEGIFKIDGYIDGQATSPEKISEYIQERIALIE